MAETIPQGKLHLDWIETVRGYIVIIPDGYQPFQLTNGQWILVTDNTGTKRMSLEG